MKIIQVHNVDKKLNKQLNYIAKNNGETKTDFLRPKIKNFIDSFPDELKQPKQTTKGPMISITGIPEKTKGELTNICKNLNISASCLLRPELKRIADTSPDFLKTEND